MALSIGMIGGQNLDYAGTAVAIRLKLLTRYCLSARESASPASRSSWSAAHAALDGQEQSCREKLSLVLKVELNRPVPARGSLDTTALIEKVPVRRAVLFDLHVSLIEEV
jgi:hypothetical protein